MALIDRIGNGAKLRLEDGIELAARHGVRYVDVQLDTDDNAFNSFDAARAKAVRGACERGGIHLGLHTASAVNVAEHAPVVAEAAGFSGHYTNAFGSLEDMLAARGRLVALARDSGVDVG